MTERSQKAARMCPACGEDSTVYRCIDRADGSVLRKRRCKRCGAKFKTLEKFYGGSYTARQP